MYLYHVLQITFLELHIITVVATQGETFFDNWVKSYRLEISIDCITYYGVQDVNSDSLVNFI